MSTAKDFYEVSHSKCHDIKTLFVTKVSVESFTATLDQRWKKTATITDIQSMHHFRVYDDDHLLTSTFSGALMNKLRINKKVTPVKTSSKCLR